MGECCKVSAPQESSQTPCPRCGEVGRVVADETIRAILKRGAATALLALERRFCKTRTCKVLYYGADGRFVEKDAAVVRIGEQETEDPIPLCYCFNFSRADVRREVAKTGSSSIPARIVAELKPDSDARRCKTPEGAGGWGAV